MAAMLGRHHRPHESLIRAGQPIVDRVADSTGETALLACLHGSRRVILCHAEGKQTIRVGTDAIVLEDIYGTATGRLLLAFLPESERDALLRDVPPTAPAWGIAGTVDEMRQALSETRRTGYALNPDYDDMAQLALPVHGGSAVVAAIGCFAPGRLPFPARRLVYLCRSIRGTAAAPGVQEESVCFAWMPSPSIPRDDRRA